MRSMRKKNRRIMSARGFDRNDIGRLLEIVKSWQTMIKRYRDSGNEFPEAVLSDLEASMRSVLRDYGAVSASSRLRKRPIKAAESYGWVVEDWEAWDAYEFAIDSGYWDEVTLNADIVQTLGTDELASSLAYIFRMNDFRQWKGEDEDEDEDYE